MEESVNVAVHKMRQVQNVNTRKSLAMDSKQSGDAEKKYETVSSKSTSKNNNSKTHWE